MLHILGQQLQEVLMNVPVQDLPVQYAAPDYYLLGRDGQSDIEAQLSQVVSDELPDLITILYFVQLDEVNACPFGDGSVGHHALEAALVEGAHSLEVLVLLGMSLHSE